MEKIYGTKERQDCLMRVGQSKWILFYGFGKDDEASDTGWEFRHTFDHKPRLSEIKELVISAINSLTNDKIVNGFAWNNQPVYLSVENQLNYAAIERCKDIHFPPQIKNKRTGRRYAYLPNFQECRGLLCVLTGYCSVYHGDHTKWLE